jgi:hypothetical protein
MPDYRKLMDDSMEQNMKALQKASQSGAKVDAVANKHSQISKIYSEDKSVDDSRE